MPIELRSGHPWILALLLLLSVAPIKAQDALAKIKKSAERSTLDQKGTHPFHLKATVGPSMERYKDSGRTGEVEIWWKAPGEYRRELHATGFHQVQIVSGGTVWEKNEGDYFPDWLRIIVEAMVRPLPLESAAMHGVKPDKEKSMFGSDYLTWEKPLPANMQPEKQDVALRDATGLFFYDGGLGWGAEFTDYASFHGRDVARTIKSGSPEVVAKIQLEDLPKVSADWFDVKAPGGDAAPIRTVEVDNAPVDPDLKVPGAPPAWPEVTNQPLDGVVWADLVLDRKGHVREPFTTISDNPLIKPAAHDYLAGLQFKPVLRDGTPVQVVRRVTMHFELHHPKGFEDLGTARQAFERGRPVSSLSAGAKAPYELKATFTVGGQNGPEHGTYEDAWKDATHWRREAAMGANHVVRSQDGEQQYLLADGPEAKVLRLVLQIVEPIPALDTFGESDWRLRYDGTGDDQRLRVLRGPESPDGSFDSQGTNGYWFDAKGRLTSAYVHGLMLSYVDATEFRGIDVPRKIVGKAANGATAFLLQVTDLGPAGTLSEAQFKVSGHEWKRQFTAEVR